MKLRLKGNPQNALRLRLLRSEMEHLAAGEIVRETVTLGPGADRTFTYMLTGDATAETVQVEYGDSQVHVIVPHQRVLLWAQEDQTGIYETLSCGPGVALELVLEKDFACIDQKADNTDTFPNSKASHAV